MLVDTGPHGAAVTEAQGALRDAISAVQNLLVLLRSLRVGPRPIASVLAEIRQSIAATPDALASLLRGLGFLDAQASRALLDFLQARVAETVDALRLAEGTALEARARLALEAEVLRLVPQLDAVRELAELLTLASTPPTELDAAELIEATFVPHSRPGLIGPTIQLHVEAPLRGQFSVQANPQAALRLMRLALGHVHGGPAVGWTLAQGSMRSRLQGHRYTIAFGERGSVRGDAVLVRTPLVIPPTAGIVALFCAHGGVEVTLEHALAAARISFPLG